VNYLNNKAYARGIRNNNPFNLVISSTPWNGKIPVSQNKDGKFEQFARMQDGVRAGMLQIITDVKRGKNTVAAFLSKFAPTSENNTSEYIRFVVSQIGSSFIDLSEETVLVLAKAIVKMENGSDAQYITESDYRWALDNLGVELKKKAVARIGRLLSSRRLALQL